MLNLLIADDHPIVRTGTKYTLKEHFEEIQIFEARNGDELIACVKEQPINLVLMDLNMPETDPQRVLQTILILKPEISVIIFSMNKEEIFGLMYLKMGAMGYLRKGCEEIELVKAVRCVLDGNVYIKKEMQPFYLGKTTLADKNNPFTELTRKELEVLRHLSRGESIANICKVMNISSSTVGTHKAKILEKLRITNMFELRSITELYPL
jgi:two-component system invasion response regulator UvrY